MRSDRLLLVGAAVVLAVGLLALCQGQRSTAARPTVQRVPTTPRPAPHDQAIAAPAELSSTPALSPLERYEQVERMMAAIDAMPDAERREALTRLYRAAMDLPAADGAGELCKAAAGRMAFRGLYREAIDLYDRAARISTDPLTRALALASLGSMTAIDLPEYVGVAKRSFVELDRMFRAGEVAGFVTQDLWADALFYLAYYAELEGDHAASVRYHEEALEKRSPTHRTATDRLRRELELPRRLALAGRGEDAVARLNEVLRRNPDSGIAPEPADHLPPGARAAWLASRNQLLGLKPADPRYSTHLEDIAVDPRLNSLPESLPFLNTLGFSYLRQSRWAEAAAVFARNLQVFAPMGERGDLNSAQLEHVRQSMWQLGEALEGMGEHQRAGAAYRALMERFPASEEARWARDALARLAARAR